MSLTTHQLAILDTETRWPAPSARKSEHIVRVLKITRARYYQMLNQILDDPDALEHDPVTVHRLRKLRDGRVNGRAQRSLSLGGVDAP